MDWNEGATGSGVGADAPKDPVLDGGRLDEIRALDPEGARGVLARIVRLYLDDAPRLLQALQEQAALAEPAGLWRAAHSLKTASANLGAVHLASLCREIETLGRSGRADGAAELVADAAKAFQQARLALSAFLPGSGLEPA